MKRWKMPLPIMAPVIHAEELYLGSGLGTKVTATATALNEGIAETPAAYIVVSTDGDDATGNGSWTTPYKTLVTAFAAWDATRHTIYVLAGEYEEAATLTWPNVTGLSLVGLGSVSVSNADAAAQVLAIAPTFTASTFEASVKDIAFVADTQIGIKIANSGMTKKLNIYLDGVSCEYDTSGDSVDIAGTVSGQAVRVYGTRCSFEGLFHYTVNDAGSRMRFSNSSFVGGITTAGAVKAEVSLRNCSVLTGGITIGSATQDITYVGCVYATDADPAVYTELVNSYSA